MSAILAIALIYLRWDIVGPWMLSLGFKADDAYWFVVAVVLITGVVMVRRAYRR
jgi:hypothetical protein